MRIAYLIASANGGGAERLLIPACNFLRDVGHEVIVFAPCKGDGRARSWWENAGIKFCIQNNTFTHDPMFIFWLRQYFKAWKPDLIWTSHDDITQVGQYIGKELRIPVVSWHHIDYLYCSLIHTGGDTCLWVSDARSTTEMLAQHLSAERLAHWPPPLFQENPSKLAQPWQPGTPLRFGSVGRLHYHKGYDVLIKALSLLDDETRSIPFHITIVGDGPEQHNLQSLISQYNLQNYITLAGFMADPQPFLSTLHLSINPSRLESLCNAAHEAMNLGLPLIATDVAELKSSVQNNKTGWSVPSEDPIALSNALKEALHNPHTLASMGQNARDYVSQTFSQEAFSQNGHTVLEKIYNLTGLK